jgi:hypothetical protein
MKTDANWVLRVGTGVLALSFAFAVASCGGHGGGNLGASAVKPSGNGSTPATTTAKTSNPVTITSTDDIAKLPPDEQKLFTDPGWNQPYIQPDPATQGLPAPTSDLLLKLTRERDQAGDQLQPRGMTAAPNTGGKGVSWTATGSAAYGNANPPYATPVPNYDHQATILQGEYYQFKFDATPTYGCNADGSNEDPNMNPPSALEDTILQFNQAGLTGATVPVSYVLEGISTPNWFNTGGSHGTDPGPNPRCAVYQEYSSTRAGDPTTNPPAPGDAKFAEISYRSDLTQYRAGPGGGVGPTGTQCSVGQIAHGVSGNFWKAFNRINQATPNQTPVANYNILIAPADDGNGVGSSDAAFKSVGGTQVAYQTFYFGSVSACYGGAWIVGLTSTTSTCAAFSGEFTSTPDQLYNPVYGVVLKRWQQLAPPGTGPWKGPLGAPVYGPYAYNSGTATTQPGKKWYAWGWWFEKGFMWYVDNDQTLFPNTPDEAQVYTFSGSNVYCAQATDTYTQQLPSTFFLGDSNSVFKVNVSVTGYSKDDTTYTAPVYNTTLGRYQIGMNPIPATNNEQVWLAANCSGYGGHPDASCNYNTVIWAWRDGTISGPFNYTDGQTQKHLYSGVQQGKSGQNHQNIYVLRVQLTDAQGDIAYGDSLPIELGSYTSALDGDVLLVNASTTSGWGTSSDNYKAVKADLDSIKGVLPNFIYHEENYAAGTTLADAKRHRVTIWWHGGPTGNNPSTLNTDKYTSQEVDDMKNIMAAPNPRAILNFSQNVGIGDGSGSYLRGFNYNYYYINPAATPATPSTGAYNTPATFLDGIGGYSPDVNYGYTNQPVSGKMSYIINGSDYSYIQYYVFYYYGGTTLGELYNGVNSSGYSPSYLYNSDMTQEQVTNFSPQGGSTLPGRSGTQHGGRMDAAWDTYDSISWGQTATGFRNYVVTYPWKPVQESGNFQNGGMYGTSGIKSWHILRNMLASLDNTIGSGLGTPTYNQYSGTTEIVSVTANQFLAVGGVNQGSTAVTGVDYPDSAASGSTDANSYRSNNTGLPGGSNYLIQKAERNLTGDNALNGNDLQFDFPFYAYLVDPDSSVTSAGTGSLNVHCSWTYGGLLLVNGGEWTRVDPAGGGYKDWATLTSGVASNLKKAAAGYYWSMAGGFGGCVRAGYGPSIPQLTFDNRDGAVNFECIAHWPSSLSYGSNPATVRWSLYPAHGVNDLNNPGHYYGERSSFFTKWISDTDVDPSMTPPAGAPKRNAFSFNMPDFNYTGALGGGRVTDFNYGTVKGWDGDIDRDNVRGEDGISTPSSDDKFPARCRVFTNFASYVNYTTYTQYPDWVPDPSSFVEGGVYLVDKGPAITKVAITDDPAKPDPKDTVTTVADHVWDVKLSFIILYGDPGYKVEYNPDYTGSGTWSLIPGNPPNSTDPMDQVNGYPANGSHSPTVRVTNPNYGDYTFAVRVTDLAPNAGGDLSAVYSWPNKVSLKPPFKEVVLQDPSSDSPGGRDASKIQADLESIYGAGTVDVKTTSQVGSGLPNNSLDNYDVIAWASDVKGAADVENRFFGYGIPFSGGPGNQNFSVIRNAHVNHQAAVLLIGQDTYGTGFAWLFSPYYSNTIRECTPFSNTTGGGYGGYWTSWYYSGAYPDFPNTGYNVFGPVATTPNAVGDMTALESPGNDPGDSWTAYASSANILRNVTDSTNYPAGNCGHFSSSWFSVFGQTYICGSYARRNVSTDQACVAFNANWGDLLATQGSNTRAAVLENMLCAGKATSRYNSPNYP